jgi:hypothetical protein
MNRYSSYNNVVLATVTGYWDGIALGQHAGCRKKISYAEKNELKIR